MPPWVDDELATADFGDPRLNARWRLRVERLSQKPSWKFPAACRGHAAIPAASRFLDNERVTAAQVLAPHRDATWARIRQQPVVILAQDTTETDVTRPHERMTGAGPLSADSRRGFFEHAVRAVTPENLVLGVVAAKVWARPPDDGSQTAAQKREARRAKPIADQESVRWREGYQHACQVAQEAPETQIVCVSDSEGDGYECFLDGQAARPGPKAAWIVRACQNRQVVPAAAPAAAPVPARLWEQVAATPVFHTLTGEVSRRNEPKVRTDERQRKQPRRARHAHLSVQAARVTLQAPARPDGPLANVVVHVVLARETNPPAGEEPIEWLLLTSLPIDTLEEVLRVIADYGVRWQIEMFHPHYPSSAGLYRGRWAAYN